MHPIKCSLGKVKLVDEVVLSAAVWTHAHFIPHRLGPPVKRLESGYPFCFVYFSRGPSPKKG